jgi:NAD(P)-dependent dehydrogenase (short-subunit alcohol dehydrogenase family)
MTVQLRGKSVLVTGVTSGLGRELAVVLTRRGAQVVGMGRREEPGLALQEELRRAGSSFAFVAGDITVRADCDRVVARCRSEFGQVDVLINNAANTRPTGRLEETTDEEWTGTLNPNLYGAFNMCRAVLPAMHAQRDGVIINIASIAGVQGLVRHAAYGAAKAGLIQLTRVLAVENSGRGVRANTIVIGSVETAGSNRARAQISANWAPAASGGPLAAMRMSVTEAAKAVTLLCSDDARPVTGAVLAVDNGYSAGWPFSTLMELGSSGLLPDAAPSGAPPRAAALAPGRVRDES